MTPGVPYTPNYYRDASQRSKITRLLLLALVVRALGAWKIDNLNHANELHRIFKTNINVVGWAVLWVFLVAASDYEATTDLAVAFAMLILLAITVNYGEKAFRNVQRKIQFSAPAIEPPTTPAT